MARIKNIKQKMLQLDPGTFQNLCDYYLCKKGYSNIVSLGSEAGTWKTTPGTPDTYFITSDGKYIFAEYTTQQANLFVKIKSDLKKCLDISKTNINYDKISEIIYCHTSSNITPSQDMEIRNLCNKVGINLTIIGIDELAEDINANYHDIVRDFLGISIDTEQILSYDDFINSYNRNLMAAPIDTEFLFRDKEIELINEKYKEFDIIILSGLAGVGKTRLALQYARNHSETNNEKLYCIHNKDLPIYEDLKISIDTPGDYFIFIDDANQLSGLEHIIRYTTKKSEGYSVKLLITVRDYALQKVKNDICEIASYDNIKVESFTDDEIKKLLETTLEIFNRDYQERIIIIAEGNARIAILAGKIALSSNSLYSIADVSQLYENYYGASLKKQTIFNDNKMYITAGIIAFLGAIHLDYIDPLIPILDEKGINGNCFIENTKILHDNEIVDIYNDKAVRFSDQCMSNYLLKYVFYDKKLISLSAMIKTCFQNHKERTILAVNTLINIYINKDISLFVKREIKILWDELSQKKSPIFLDFVKVFFRINPLETLPILKKKLNQKKM